MGIYIPEEDYHPIKEISQKLKLKSLPKGVREKVLYEVICAYESFKNVLDDLNSLLEIIVEETKNLDDVVWRGDEGKADSIKVYYDDRWKRLEEFDGEEVEGYEVIRKADKYDGPPEAKYRRLYRVRKVKFRKDKGNWVPEKNWVEKPTEITKIVRNVVKEIVNELDIEVGLSGSGLRGTMGPNSNLNYFIIGDEKLDEKFYNIFYDRIQAKGYTIERGPHTVVKDPKDIKDDTYVLLITKDKMGIVDLKKYLNYKAHQEGS